MAGSGTATHCFKFPPFVTEVLCTVVFGFLCLVFVSFFFVQSSLTGSLKIRGRRGGSGAVRPRFGAADRTAPAASPLDAPLGFIGSNSENVCCVQSEG